MKFLFIHQNFPGQFRHVLRALAENPEHQVVGIGDATRLKSRPAFHPKILTIGYDQEKLGSDQTHHYIRDFEGHIRRGQNVARACLTLKDKGFYPDVIVAHPGWGEALFLKEIYPNAKHVYYFEYYYHSSGGDLGFDPEFTTNIDDQLKVQVRNATQLLALTATDTGISPTYWQKSRYPDELQHKIEVIHEGIDTEVIRPNSNATVTINGRKLTSRDEIITYVARNLEPYRGIHTFIRSLPKLLKLLPNARVIIVGSDGVSYGRRLPEGQTYKMKYINELPKDTDWERVHFVGHVPYADYLSVLQVSSCHVYLTYPFVLSWSMLEAMSAGCALVASSTPPVEEIIRENENALLVDFFDTNKLAETVAMVVNHPDGYRQMRENARNTIIESYDLNTKCLPRQLSLLLE